MKSLKPQDILVLLKLLTWPRSQPWRYQDLAQSIGLSPSQVHDAIKRTQKSGLYNAHTKQPRKKALLEFLIHGLKYVFPVAPGTVSKGVPTSHSAEPLSSRIRSQENDQCVWPLAQGKITGLAITPLYKSAPQAAMDDPALHQLLALVDAIRAGRARERQIAGQELSQRLA